MEVLGHALLIIRPDRNEHIVYIPGRDLLSMCEWIAARLGYAVSLDTEDNCEAGLQSRLSKKGLPRKIEKQDCKAGLQSRIASRWQSRMAKQDGKAGLRSMLAQKACHAQDYKAGLPNRIAQQDGRAG